MTTKRKINESKIYLCSQEVSIRPAFQQTELNPSADASALCASGAASLGGRKARYEVAKNAKHALEGSNSSKMF